MDPFNFDAANKIIRKKIMEAAPGEFEMVGKGRFGGDRLCLKADHQVTVEARGGRYGSMVKYVEVCFHLGYGGGKEAGARDTWKTDFNQDGTFDVKKVIARARKGLDARKTQEAVRKKEQAAYKAKETAIADNEKALAEALKDDPVLKKAGSGMGGFRSTYFQFPNGFTVSLNVTVSGISVNDIKVFEQLTPEKARDLLLAVASLPKVGEE